MGYQENSVVLHTDDSFMPSRKLAWASWNFSPEKAAIRPALGHLLYEYSSGAEQPRVFPRFSQRRAQDQSRKTLREFTYAHPVYSAESSVAQGRRTEICGHNRTHFCGAYWYNGFHEDGVRSALDVAERFGQSL